MNRERLISPTDMELLNNQGSYLDKCWLVHLNQAHCVPHSLTRPRLGGKPQSGGCQKSPQTVSSGILGFKGRQGKKSHNNNNNKNTCEKHSWSETFAPFVLIVDPVTHPQTIKRYKGDTYFSPNFLCATSFLWLEDFFLLFFVLCGKNPTLMWEESSERDVRVLKDRFSASFPRSLRSDLWKTDLCKLQLSYFTVFIQLLVIGHRVQVGVAMVSASFTFVL